MTLSNVPTFVIRDGVEDDFQACIQIDHSYETEYVWQVQMHHEDYRDEWNITLKVERLPRFIEIEYPADISRLRLTAPDNHCFLVAANRENTQIFGYLAMIHDRAHHFGQILDVVVTRPYRRFQIGTRLLNVARRWAKERYLTRILIQTQTKNFPAINFCQQSGFSFCGFNDRYFPNQDIAIFFSQSMR
jgi:GNAT superfamily N-acetyltransferase